DERDGLSTTNLMELEFYDIMRQARLNAPLPEGTFTKIDIIKKDFDQTGSSELEKLHALQVTRSYRLFKQQALQKVDVKVLQHGEDVLAQLRELQKLYAQKLV